MSVYAHRKIRITAAEVAAHPEWARALYLQGLDSPTETARGSRHLAGAGLRHAHVDPDDDRYAWTMRRTPWARPA